MVGTKGLRVLALGALACCTGGAAIAAAPEVLGAEAAVGGAEELSPVDRKGVRSAMSVYTPSPVTHLPQSAAKTTLTTQHNGDDAIFTHGTPESPPPPIEALALMGMSAPVPLNPSSVANARLAPSAIECECHVCNSTGTELYGNEDAT